MDLAKKKILITGGTSGLGLETARLLISKGAEVYATGRNMDDPLEENAAFRFIRTDFADMKMVASTFRDLLKDDLRFDYIVNNAGVLSPPEYNETGDGFEYTFQVNFLSHLVINEIIMKRGAYNDPLTTIVVTSPVYKHVSSGFRIPVRESYKPFRVYSESKFYLLLAGDILRKDFPCSNFNLIGFNPGTFGSGIYRMQRRWFQFMYRVAAPFMRSSSNVARSLCRLIEMGNYEFNGIYSRNSNKPSFISPPGEAAEDFLIQCHELIKDLTA